MSHSIRIILFYTLCSAVSNAAVFNFTMFREKWSTKYEIVFDKVNRTLIENDNMQIYYLTGPVSVTRDFSDANGRVRYKLRRREGDDLMEIPNIPDNFVPICEYSLGFFKNYSLPMSENHNDFPVVSDTDCLYKEGKYNLFEVDDIEKLNAPTQLPEGDYFLDVWFYDTMGYTVGGHVAYFTSIDL